MTEVSKQQPQIEVKTDNYVLISILLPCPILQLSSGQTSKSLKSIFTLRSYIS